MGKNASDQLVERLIAWGIDRVFGYPGDGINGVMEALNGKQDEIRFIQTRHEEMAAFMACAHAKFTGQAGVCISTSGPGAIHLLNGLYDAKKDHMPVVAIVGQQARLAMGADYQQEVDLISLFKDVAGNYVHRATHPAQIRQLVDRATRIALSERQPTCIILPNDVQEMDAATPPRSHGSTFTGVGYQYPRIVPQEADLHRAASVLNEGKKVAMLVGAGALGAGREIQQLAETLGSGVAKALLGKAVIPDDVPYCTGAIGLLGTKPSWDMMMDCDTLLIIGSSFPYAEFLPPEGQARGVQIDVKARMLSLRYPNEVNLHGEAGETIHALLPMLDRKKDRGWQETIEKNVAEWWDILKKRAEQTADPINPQYVFWELSPRLPDDAIITCDSGSAANWFARDLKVREGMKASLSGGLATMCPGVPYAIAAKFAYPERHVVALVGDGAMQMLGNNGLVTIGRHWREWPDARLVIMVLNNRDLNQVTWEQRVMAGEPKFEGSQSLPEFSYARYAEMLGLKGIEVREREQVAPAWDEAFASDRPVVLDVHTDPEVPPLPPHIKFDQAKSFLQAILNKDPERKHMIVQSAKDMLAGLKP